MTGVVAALVGVALFTMIAPGPRPLTPDDVRTGIDQALASMTPPPPRSQLVYAAIRPSLVLVQTDLAGGAGASPGASPGAVPPASPGASPGPSARGSARPLRATPGAAPTAAPGSPPIAAPGTTPGASASVAPDSGGLGSGVIIDAAGDILTSLHVVAGATSIQVTFADGTTSRARVSATQPENDIAVLQADQLPADVVPATLGNSHAIQVGSEAYVVGNPFGLYGSISAGVVSGLDRSLQIDASGRVLSGLIQVDAAVNPGNSGGPLLNSDGQVVGIVAALLNPTRQDVFVGIGLAVPIEVAGGAAGLPPY